VGDEMTESGEFLCDEWRSMQRRLVAHLRAPRSSDLADKTSTIDASVYTDVDRFEAERRLLFDEAGPPIVVVRANNGELRAFLNLCPHRGSRLVDSFDSSPRMTCPLHAWNFDLEARLTGLPQAVAIEGLDRDAHGLVAVPVEEWGGMIFVCVDPDGEIHVEDFLGPIGPLLASLDRGRLDPGRIDVSPLSGRERRRDDQSGFDLSTQRIGGRR